MSKPVVQVDAGRAVSDVFVVNAAPSRPLNSPTSSGPRVATLKSETPWRPQARTIGIGPADRQLQFARQATAAEAKALGLVDSVTSAAQLLPAARAAVAAALELPDFGRHITKERLHGDFARAWEAQVPLVPLPTITRAPKRP